MKWLRALLDFFRPIPKCRECGLLFAEARDIDCFCRCWEQATNGDDSGCKKDLTYTYTPPIIPQSTNGV